MHSNITTALSSAGINDEDVDIHKVGQWQRVSTEDKPGKRNGAVMVFDDRPVCLFYRNYATGVSGYCGENGSSRRLSMGHLHQAAVKRNDQRAESQAQAAERALSVWSAATQADSNHPYLIRKHVGPHGVREKNGSLIIPMFDGHEMIWSYQSIFPSGDKRYMKGGRKEGCFYLIGGPARGHLAIAEGFATAASVYECTDLPVAVCFDAPNLVPAASALRKKYPAAWIILAADNDVRTEPNTGLVKAQEAAHAVEGTVVYPDFGRIALTEKLSDWNDMHVRYGTGFVRELFLGAL